MVKVRIVHLCIIAVILCCAAGCEKTGYVVTLSTDLMDYANIVLIETLLKDRGYDFKNYRTDGGSMAVWRERQVQVPRHQNEIYSLLERRLDSRSESFVHVYLLYVKDESRHAAAHCRISIVNEIAGSTIAEVRAEIDTLGDLLFRELSASGVGSLKMERDEVSPPAFY